MSRVSNFEVLSKREQPVIFIRTTTSVEKLPILIGESYEKMGAYLGELGAYLSDVPYVAYRNMDMQSLDVEIGFPVFMGLPEKGEIKAGTIAAGKVVFCMYRGAYSECESTYKEMEKWITDNGFTPTGMAYEHYYNSPRDFPETEMLTMIVMPIL
ncbi:MAG: GyrI-like domain-containing protein [Nitrososphaerota archaeon]|jgi:effector-binding domain-containing protein|nr:GyrI-like domain-containing protein [Nitrososphaerota archaeon]